MDSAVANSLKTVMSQLTVGRALNIMASVMSSPPRFPVIHLSIALSAIARDLESRHVLRYFTSAGEDLSVGIELADEKWNAALSWDIVGGGGV